jgi:hypothetical protein
MTIQAEQNIVAEDFLQSPDGSEHKGVRTRSNGRIDPKFSQALTMTAGETISGATTPVPVYPKSADGEWYACDGNDQTKLAFDGFAVSNGTDGNNIEIQFEGIVEGFTDLTAGARYYVQNDGSIDTSVGTYEVQVGIAVSATELRIERGSFEYMGSASASNGTDLTAPAAARFAIIDFSADGEITIARRGRTGGNTIVHDPSGGVGVDAAWSGSTITMTLSDDTASASYTAYFYR